MRLLPMCQCTPPQRSRSDHASSKARRKRLLSLWQRFCLASGASLRSRATDPVTVQKNAYRPLERATSMIRLMVSRPRPADSIWAA